jgi:hypothetical protein
MDNLYEINQSIETIGHSVWMIGSVIIDGSIVGFAAKFAEHRSVYYTLAASGFPTHDSEKVN